MALYCGFCKYFNDFEHTYVEKLDGFGRKQHCCSFYHIAYSIRRHKAQSPPCEYFVDKRKPIQLTFNF